VRRPVTIALVGKYVQLHEAYLSVWEALKHSAIHHGRDLRMLWVDSEEITRDTVEERLALADGVIVPGGFGYRGIEGKIEAIQYCRERSIPYLGVCLGMQCAVIEFARTVCGMEGANSWEFDEETPFPVIDLLPEQKAVEDMGGTMRLGAQRVELVRGTRAAEAYGADETFERHRHRFEVNNALRPQLETAGLVVSGTHADGRLVEIVELREHPFFVASQFHPEFKSRPTRPAPLFREFVGAAARYHEQREGELEESLRQS
jgi:CTP synthase